MVLTNPDQSAILYMRLHRGFHKWRYPKMDAIICYIMENPLKVDDWGVPLFQETSKWVSYPKALKSISLRVTAGALGLETCCLHPRSVPANHQERNPSWAVAWHHPTEPTERGKLWHFQFLLHQKFSMDSKMIQTNQLGCPTGARKASANTCSEVVLGLLPSAVKHVESANLL